MDDQGVLSKWRERRMRSDEVRKKQEQIAGKKTQVFILNEVRAI
jgi:hypothetical protein